jgi:hypothetical protein
MQHFVQMVAQRNVVCCQKLARIRADAAESRDIIQMLQLPEVQGGIPKLHCVASPFAPHPSACMHERLITHRGIPTTMTVLQRLLHRSSCVICKHVMTCMIRPDQDARERVANAGFPPACSSAGVVLELPRVLIEQLVPKCEPTRIAQQSILAAVC